MKTRYAAGLSLIGMGAGFATTLFLPDTPTVELLKGGFEAGLVGGFADWFAVTALFRHPLGIPIPHTSLLLKNRDKIAKALVSALENELLKKESITGKLKQFQLLKLAGSAATKMIAKRDNRVAAVKFARALVEKLPLETLAPHLQSALVAIVRGADARPLTEKAIRAAIDGRLDERALDYALREGGVWAAKPETGRMLGELALRKVSEAKVGGLMGFAVQAFAGFMNEEKLGTMIQQLLLSAIHDLLLPGSESREKLLEELRAKLVELARDEGLIGTGQAWLADKAGRPDSGKLILDSLERLRASWLAALDKEIAGGGRKVVPVVRFCIRKLQAEKALMDRAESKMLSLIVDAVEANHYRIGLLIRDNIDRMNDKELVRMLEEKIGGDLQWIRVNGALCGFLIGLALTGFQMLM
ncbi:DUF445 domain-containing protein [Paenibacillaceae bacterium WGS1546]|uniref:DUF445 domain-containing protein n=1 Tax=Cohnella sp. WGS1546 TaxID=3366810 RepID=UPI00372D2572